MDPTRRNCFVCAMSALQEPCVMNALKDTMDQTVKSALQMARGECVLEEVCVVRVKKGLGNVCALRSTTPRNWAVLLRLNPTKRKYHSHKEYRYYL